MGASFMSARIGKILRLLLPVCSLTGCTAVTHFRGLSIGDDSVYVAGLPPMHQDKYYSCGAACLAAVATYWNVPVGRFRAQCPRYSEDTTGRDLQQLAENLGLDAFVYRGSIADLRDNLEKGRPVIVMIPQLVLPEGGLVSVSLIDAWNSWGHKPAHWVVVLGFTRSKGVIVYDPESGSAVIKEQAFEKWWAKKSYLSVLVSARG